MLSFLSELNSRFAVSSVLPHEMIDERMCKWILQGALQDVLQGTLQYHL